MNLAQLTTEREQLTALRQHLVDQTAIAVGLNPALLAFEGHDAGPPSAPQAAEAWTKAFTPPRAR